MFVIYFISPLSNISGTLTKKDVSFVLNHGNINTEQNYELIYSEESGASFNGDHLNYYCIQLESFEFQNKQSSKWFEGPEVNPIYQKGRKEVGGIGRIDECFNGEHDANSIDIQANIWSMDIRRDFIEGAIIILFHKPSKRLLYVSFQT